MSSGDGSSSAATLVQRAIVREASQPSTPLFLKSILHIQKIWEPRVFRCVRWRIDRRTAYLVILIISVKATEIDVVRGLSEASVSMANFAISRERDC